MGRTLARHLRSFGEVHLAASLAEAYELLPKLPQLGALILDWGLPDGTGGELLAHLGDDRSVPCLVVTGQLDADVLNAAQLFGAEVTIKPSVTKNVEAFMSRVTGRARFVDDALEEYVALWGLTPRHREILQRAATGVARSELAAQLGVAEATLKSHIRTMKKRTGAPSLSTMVQEVLVRALRRLS